MAWNLVRVKWNGLDTMIVNTNVESIQVENHILQPSVDRNEIIRIAVTDFPPTVVYVIREGSIQNIQELGKTYHFPVVEVNEDTIPKTINDELNKVYSDTMVFVYSKDYPEHLFQGMTVHLHPSPIQH